MNKLDNDTRLDMRTISWTIERLMSISDAKLPGAYKTLVNADAIAELVEGALYHNLDCDLFAFPSRNTYVEINVDRASVFEYINNRRGEEKGGQNAI